MTLGPWLRQQKNRKDWIDGLAAAARADPRFPEDSGLDQVGKRLAEMVAEGDMFRLANGRQKLYLPCARVLYNGW